MRQGNGTELLGPNDPRSASIGVIYVSSTDDRKSVLAALLTQEKLARKEIAVVLPQLNKAFQRAQDFDDLKNAQRQRKMRAKVVFVIPSNAAAADVARQRRYAVYESPESYADAVRAEMPIVDAGEGSGAIRTGGLFGGPKKAGAIGGAAAAGAVGGAIVAGGLAGHPQGNVSGTGDAGPGGTAQSAGGLPPNTPPEHEDAAAHWPPQRYTGADGDEEDDEQSATQRGGGGSAFAAGAAGGLVAGGMLSHQAQHGAEDAGLDDDWDALPPSAAPAGALPVTPAASGIPPTPRNSRQLSPNGPQQVPATPRNSRQLGGAAAAGAAAGAVAAGGPEIIDLGMPAAARKRDTTKLPTYGATGPTTASKSNAQRRNSAKMAVAGMGAGALAGAAVAGGAASAAGQRPAAGAASATGRTPTPRRSSRRRRPVWLIVLLLLLLTLLLFGAIASFVPGVRTKVTQVFSSVAAPAVPASPASITITPDSKLVPNSYVVRAVTDNPDPTKRQVGLNILTFSPPAQTKAVAASGHTHIDPKAATGQITLINGTATPLTINPTVLDAGNGVQITTDVQVTVPAGNPGVSFSSQNVSAHALSAGTAGNIAVLSINKPCCVGGITAKNLTAFTGGQDASDYTFLSKGDVNGAAGPIVTSMAQQAKEGLKGKLKANEQFAQDPTCPDPVYSADQKIGDQGFEVKSANVTVTAKCTGLAFDAVAAQTLVKGLLQNDAGVPPGYKLAGDVVTRTSVTEVKPTFATLQVQAVGRWYAVFGPAEEKDIATHIKGLSTAKARAYLKGLKTISDENITLQDNGTTLPADPAQISFTVKTVAAATAADLPAAPPAIPVGPGGGNGSDGGNGTAITPTVVVNAKE